MTTFGGSTIPPLFTASGDALFVRAVGTKYEHFNYPNADGAVALDISAARQVGDIIVVMVAALSSVQLESGSNYTLRTIGVGGTWLIYERVATGDANDNFTWAASGAGITSVRNAQSLVLAAQKSTQSVAFLERSLSRNQAGGGNLVRAALQLPSDNKILTVCPLNASRTIGLPELMPQTITPTDIPLSSGAYFFNTGVGNYYWYQFTYLFEAVAAAVAEVEVVHEPNVFASPFVSQWTTYHLV